MTPSKGALAVPYYAETEEEQAKLQELQSARQKLQEALEGRNRLFDPVLLAMAQGFLSPTPTGKFGESLANVAKAVAPAQEAEEKRGREIAQMRAELAAMELAGAQAARDERMIRNIISPQKPGAVSPAAAAQPVAEPTGVEVGKPLAPRAEAPTTRANELEGSTVDKFSSDDLLKMSMSINPRVQALGKAILNIREDQRKNYVSVGGNLVDTRTNKVIYRTPEKQELTSFPGLDDLVYLTPEQRDAILEELSKVPPENRQARLKQLVAGLPTKSQLEARTQEAAKRAESVVKAEEKIFTDASVAPDLIRSADTLIQLATSPNTRRTFGILQQSGFLGALGQLGEDALRVGNFNIGIPSIETAIRTATRSPAEIRAAEIAASEATRLELNFRKIFYQGTGAVSNAENETVRRLGGSIKDTPEGLIAKAEMIKARAEFDQKVADIFRESQERGVSVRDFKKNNKAYDEVLSAYDKKVQDIRDSIINFQPTASTTRPASNLIQGRTGVWERQPDGSLKAKRN